MVLKIAGALALAMSLWASAAQADDNSDDIKCLVVSMDMSASADQNVGSIGMLSTMYWMGRLDGRAPALDLVKQLSDTAAALKAGDLQAEAARCAAALTARGQALTKMGEELRQRRNAN